MAPLLCPSSIAKPGANLFGVQDATGHIEYLDTSIIIDQTFVEAARQGRVPEERFRFASNCVKTGCGHWDSGSSDCGLVGEIVKAMNRNAEKSLPDCAIRDCCRWYYQEAASACANCNEVVRNVRMTEVASQ